MAFELTPPPFSSSSSLSLLFDLIIIKIHLLYLNHILIIIMFRPFRSAGTVIVVLGAAVSGGGGRVQLALVHLGSRGMLLQTLMVTVTPLFQDKRDKGCGVSASESY